MQSVSAPRAGPVVRPPAVALRFASDARLVRLAATGSDGAMAAIFERHHQALHRYCHSILGNSHDAADALQNTMIKALRALPGETRTIELRPWLYRIAHNESISLLRARRTDSDLDAAAHIGDATVADLAQSRERLRSLTRDLQELTERQRGALLMRELGGLQFAEIAVALQSTPTAVKQSVYEARCALQAIEEGRAMSCETVQRTLSDGDRRMLRGMRMRGHLRACASCHDFEIALRQRPAQLSAMTAPLPLGAAAAMLHGLLGGSSSGSGGGLATGLAASAKATTGISLAAKAAAVVAISTTLAGSAVYAAPKLQTSSRADTPPPTETITKATTPRSTPTSSAARPQDPGDNAVGRSTRDRPRAANRTASAADKPTNTGKPIGTPGGKPAATPTGEPIGTAGGKPAGTPGGGPAGTPGGKPAVIPTGKPAATPRGRPAVIPTAKPTVAPSGKPAVIPSGKPAVIPSGKPAVIPSGKPAVIPSGKPTAAPTAKPAATPSATPTGSGSPPEKPNGAPAASTSGPATSPPATSATSPPAGTTSGTAAAHGRP